MILEIKEIKLIEKSSFLFEIKCSHFIIGTLRINSHVSKDFTVYSKLPGTKEKNHVKSKEEAIEFMEEELKKFLKMVIKENK